MSTSLRERVIEAYGGEARWRAATAVEVTFSAWGWAFRLKWQASFKSAHARFEIDQPRVRITPVGRGGHTGILDGQDVRIEDEQGKVVDSRSGARSYFPTGRRLLYWDRLDQTYFAGYAMWNYMVLPALLLRDDIEWREIGEANLEGRFPPSLPTHCTIQQFRFDPKTALLIQHDYTADVIGTWAKAAHVVLEHGENDGVTFSKRRRVTPRDSAGVPKGGPLLIGIDVDEWLLI